MTHHPRLLLRLPLLLATTLATSIALAAGAPGDSPTAKGSSVYYRCGPKGQDLRDTPCPPGNAGSAVDLPEDKVSPDQQRASRQRTAQETRELEGQQRQREQSEAKSARGAAGINGLTTLKPANEPPARLAQDKPTKKPPKAPKPPPAPKPPKGTKDPKSPQDDTAAKESKSP